MGSTKETASLQLLHQEPGPHLPQVAQSAPLCDQARSCQTVDLAMRNCCVSELGLPSEAASSELRSQPKNEPSEVSLGPSSSIDPAELTSGPEKQLPLNPKELDPSGSSLVCSSDSKCSSSNPSWATREKEEPGKEATSGPPAGSSQEEAKTETSSLLSASISGKPDPVSCEKKDPSSLGKIDSVTMKNMDPTSSGKKDSISMGIKDSLSSERSDPASLKDGPVSLQKGDPVSSGKVDLLTQEKANPNAIGRMDLISLGKANPSCSEKANSITSGKTDTPLLGKVDSLPLGKEDATALGKTDSLSSGKVDSVVSGKTNSTTMVKEDPGPLEKENIIASEKADPMPAGKIHPMSLGKADSTSLGKVEPMSLDKADPMSSGEVDLTSLEKVDLVSLGKAASISPEKVDSGPLRNVDPISSGKADPAFSQKIKPIPSGKVEPVLSGKTDSTPLGKTDPMSLRKEDPMFLGKADSVPLGKVDHIPLDKVEPMSLGKTNSGSLGEVNLVPSDKIDPMSLEKKDPVSSGKTDSRVLEKIIPIPLEKEERTSSRKGDSMSSEKMDPLSLKKIDPSSLEKVNPMSMVDLDAMSLGKTDPISSKKSPASRELLPENSNWSPAYPKPKAMPSSDSQQLNKETAICGGPQDTQPDFSHKATAVLTTGAETPSVKVPETQATTEKSQKTVSVSPSQGWPSGHSPKSALQKMSSAEPATARAEEISLTREEIQELPEAPQKGVGPTPAREVRTRDNFTKVPSWDVSTPQQDAGTQADTRAVCVSVAVSPMTPQDGSGPMTFSFQPTARNVPASRSPGPLLSKKDVEMQVSMGVETRSVATGPMTPVTMSPQASYPEVQVRAAEEAPEPVREVSWDEKGMTWEVYGASMEVEVLGMAIQKHLEKQIEEHGRQGGPSGPQLPNTRAGSLRGGPRPGEAKRPPSLFRALLQSMRRPRCCSRAGPTAE
ncbi:G protein-regulated inducer of neurite outgrowth 1 [Monodelphis domestica]|uniref:G protein-regulated inducer of neurite outgrowth 1 n=1 Tax=Monodelphis domestica TaxID=13616 RepID=UPI0004431CF4|nr:G protein-regulated inducer of neurite outgrowth 1 [Monodelphis domestica]